VNRGNGNNAVRKKTKKGRKAKGHFPGTRVRIHNLRKKKTKSKKKNEKSIVHAYRVSHCLQGDMIAPFTTPVSNQDKVEKS